jgi:hypothetical protein
VIGTVLTALVGILFSADTPPTPNPLPSYIGNNDLVTPGWIGFLVTFLVAVATVLLIIDMTRRIRRLRYRAEIRERLENEQAEGEADT